MDFLTLIISHLWPVVPDRPLLGGRTDDIHARHIPRIENRIHPASGIGYPMVISNRSQEKRRLTEQC